MICIRLKTTVQQKGRSLILQMEAPCSLFWLSRCLSQQLDINYRQNSTHCLCYKPNLYDWSVTSFKLITCAMALELCKRCNTASWWRHLVAHNVLPYSYLKYKQLTFTITIYPISLEPCCRTQTTSANNTNNNRQLKGFLRHNVVEVFSRDFFTIRCSSV